MVYPRHGSPCRITETEASGSTAIMVTLSPISAFQPPPLAGLRKRKPLVQPRPWSPYVRFQPFGPLPLPVCSLRHASLQPLSWAPLVRPRLFYPPPLAGGGEGVGEAASRHCRLITARTPSIFSKISLFQNRKTVNPFLARQASRLLSLGTSSACWPPSSSITIRVCQKIQNLRYIRLTVADGGIWHLPVGCSSSAATVLFLHRCNCYGDHGPCRPTDVVHSLLLPPPPNPLPQGAGESWFGCLGWFPGAASPTPSPPPARGGGIIIGAVLPGTR